ncbi:hypothetical protein EYB26_008689 [Talaromyces marneffei]|uniref:uncharacterized protein n=1 Tax=Talaromyces marneffei TaxID=37727 RepID=UPI0012A90BF1|nr:uncharacterized protein EYB26_008689 [Talaromyces marneffei]QGA20979.1 hypothetical protein EYB26_008689 [Talaromyces marneffei]
MSNSIAESLERVRSLGLLERHSTAQHSLGYHSNIAVSALYVYNSTVPTLQEPVFSALENVIQEHAILGVIPIGEDTPNPYFARLPRIDLQDVVTFVERKEAWNPNAEIDSELDETLEREHNRDFKQRYGELPFWRLLILHETSAVNAGNQSRFIACFVVHHAIGDGLSGMAFHRSFFSALTSPSEVQTSTTVTPRLVIPSQKDLIPGLEALHPLPISVSFILGTVWRELMPRWSGTVWTAENITENPYMRRSRYKSFTLSASRTADIIKISRGKNTTVTGAIESILAYTVFNQLPKKYTILKVAGPISLRSVLPKDQVDDNSIGTWSNSYVQEHNRPISGSIDEKYSYIWNEAIKVRAMITGELAKEGRNIRTGLLKLVGDSHKFFQKNIGKPRGESIELSNLGVFSTAKTAESSSWKVKKVLFSQAGNVVGSPLEVMMSTGPDSRLNIGFSWLEGVVEGTWVESVMEEFKQTIEELVSP